MLTRLLSRNIVSDVGWCLIAQTGRIFLQAVSFIFLARSLGPTGYGVLSGAVAIISILVPFCGWGSPNLIVKYVSKDPGTFPQYMGNAIFYCVSSGFVLSIFAVIIGIIALGQEFHATIFAFIILSDVFLLRIVDVGAQALQAAHRLDLSARVYLLFGISRFAAVMIHIFTSWRSSPADFAFWYFITSIFAGAIAAYMMYGHLNHLGRPRINQSTVVSAFYEGFPYSLSLAAKSIYSDIDKTMLTRMQGPEVNGLYTAAYRTITMATIPIQAIVMATTTRFIKAGQEGANGAFKYASQVLIYVGIYGILTGACIWFGAPLLSHLLGSKFDDSIPILRWLAWMPVIQGAHSILGDALMGAGRQGIRSAFQVAVAFLNIAINLALIMRFSWRGAVIATYVAEGGLALSLFGTLLFYAFKETRKRAVRDYGVPIALPS